MTKDTIAIGTKVLLCSKINGYGHIVPHNTTGTVIAYWHPGEREDRMNKVEITKGVAYQYWCDFGTGNLLFKRSELEVVQ